MTLLASYAATLAVFLAVDAVWLRRVMLPLFERELGDWLLERPRLGTAALFYAGYAAAILHFAAWGASPAEAALNGALLGLAAYGTYEMTNLATLRRWTWRMAALDMVWGATLTALSAAAGAITASAIG